MPQTVTITSEAYRFDELSDSAKEKARDWYRSLPDDYDFDCVIEDFTTIAEMIGIDFSTHEVTTMGGTKVRKNDIWWSGFCSQGDGACFEGSYGWKPGSVDKVKEHAPEDKELHRIVDELARIQADNLFGVTATIKHHGMYYHEGSVDIDVNDERNEDACIDEEEQVRELMRDLMRWFYRQLDQQNDHLYSAEYVDENIIANEYMFDEDGDRHAYA